MIVRPERAKTAGSATAPAKRLPAGPAHISSSQDGRSRAQRGHEHRPRHGQRRQGVKSYAETAPDEAKKDARHPQCGYCGQRGHHQKVRDGRDKRGPPEDEKRHWSCAERGGHGHGQISPERVRQPVK